METIVINEKEYSYTITRKNISGVYIRYKNGGLSVSAPYLMPKSIVLDYVKKNADWIEKVSSKEKYNHQLVISEGGKLTLLDKEYTIHLGGRYSLSNDIMTIKNVDSLLKGLKEVLESYIYSRTAYYFDIMKRDGVFNCSLPKMSVKTFSGRYGSYTKKTHEIKYNTYCAFASLDTLDYLIVHELSHIKEYNHQKKFYDLVSKYCPNYKELRKKLKNDGIIYSKEDIIIKE